MDDHIMEAARFFELDEQTLEPLRGGNSDAVTYRARHAGGTNRVIKFFAPSRGDVTGVFEWLEYLETLDNETPGDISFATPRRSRGGDIGYQCERDGTPLVAFVYDFAPGVEIEHRQHGLSVDFSDSAVGNVLFEQMGRAAGIMHRAARRYPLWLSQYDPGPDTACDGRTAAGGMASISAMIEAFVATETDLRTHWEGLQARVEAIPVNRETYGLCHCDYAFTNFIVDGTRFSVIDSNAGTYPFALDLGAIAGKLGSLEIDQTLALAYWRRFATAYASYTTFDESWTPWIHAMHDMKRLAFYIFNRHWMASGRDGSYDLPVMETWRREMLEDRPWIRLDLSFSPPGTVGQGPEVGGGTG